MRKKNTQITTSPECRTPHPQNQMSTVEGDYWANINIFIIFLKHDIFAWCLIIILWHERIYGTYNAIKFAAKKYKIWSIS